MLEVKRSRTFAVARGCLTGILGLTDGGSVLVPWEVWVVLDHVGVPVSDFERSKRFYAEVLSPLGYELIIEPSVSARDSEGRASLTFLDQPGQAFHIASAAADRATVDAFHEAAIAAGGRGNGGPGLRSAYHPSYYGAFAFDPDGNVTLLCPAPLGKR